MTDGRTIWWAKDSMWYDRECQVILADEFGAEGTTVMDVLSCMAKLENHGGRVKTGYRSLTKKGSIGTEDATRRIVARAVQIGALDDFTEDRLTFSARISGWKADQDLARAAVRQDRLRKAAAVQRDIPLRTVTDRDEPSPTRLRLIHEVFDYWQQQCGHPNAKLTPKRRWAVQGRIADGATIEEFRQAIDGAARAAYVDDAGVKHDDLELICRNAEKFDLFKARGIAVSPLRQLGTSKPLDMWHAINGPTPIIDPSVVDAEVVEESA